VVERPATSSFGDVRALHAGIDPCKGK